MRRKELEMEIGNMIATELPYYESEDKDDYVYIADRQDIRELANLITGYLVQKFGTSA